MAIKSHRQPCTDLHSNCAPALLPFRPLRPSQAIETINEVCGSRCNVRWRRGVGVVVVVVVSRADTRGFKHVAPDTARVARLAQYLRADGHELSLEPMNMDNKQREEWG